MPRRGDVDELAPESRSLLLTEIAQSLREIADRLGEPEWVQVTANHAEDHTNSDVSSVTGSSISYYPSNQTPQDGRRHRYHLERSGTEPRSYRPNDGSYHHYQSTQRHPEHLTRMDNVRLGVGLNINRPPNSEPRVSRFARSDSVYGRSARLESPPSPSPSHRASIHWSIRSAPDRPAPEIRFAGHSHQLPPEPPTHIASGDPDLGDIYHLDASMVRLRTPNCKPKIHLPPRGVQRSQNRWYFVTCGRKVGIFNDWEQVSKVISGVSGGHQQRTKAGEAMAYAHFKKALLAGRVEVTE